MVKECFKKVRIHLYMYVHACIMYTVFCVSLALPLLWGCGLSALSVYGAFKKFRTVTAECGVTDRALHWSQQSTRRPSHYPQEEETKVSLCM